MDWPGIVTGFAEKKLGLQSSITAILNAENWNLHPGGYRTLQRVPNIIR
jgi:hypothetical protein